MKIACYCQHVLGIGHFHRSLEICKALAVDHDTVMILGGPALSLPESAVRFHQLPGLRMDENFSRLLPCEEDADLDAVKERRQQQLFQFFSEFEPDAFLVELYPFGRKGFRFELDPVLEGIGSGTLPPCLRLCSVRDILVEKTEREKYETRVLSILEHSFDGLLIHSDPDFLPLDRTFQAVTQIPVPLHYTGFVAPPRGDRKMRETIRRQLKLAPTDRLIVASIGGGSVGAELLSSVAKAAVLLKDQANIHFHLFTGPYSPSELTADLNRQPHGQLHIHDFCNNFPDWLEAADISVSMAGYNTCMNLLTSGIPALLYPFSQNREQRLRVTALAEATGFTLLETEDLDPEQLAEKIIGGLSQGRRESKVKLDGAGVSRQLIEQPNNWRPQP